MTTGDRFIIDKNHYLIDSQTGKKCKGKIYNRSVCRYSDELTLIALPDDITDYYISIPSGEIWVTKGSVSLYGYLSFQYFGERSLEENIKIFENVILAEYIYKHGSEKLKEIIRCWINKNNIKFETKDLIIEILKLKAIDKDFTELIQAIYNFVESKLPLMKSK